MGSLRDWAKQNSKFLKLDDGESINVKYMGHVKALNKDGDETLAFKFQTMDGKTQILQSRSMALIEAFDDEGHGSFKKGDNVILTRHGLQQQTTYEVQAGTIAL